MTNYQLACPIDRNPLNSDGASLACGTGHTYPVVNGIPVLLDPRLRATHPVIDETRELARRGGLREVATTDANAIDPFVQEAVFGTCGYLYRDLQGRLTRYPIPHMRLPPGDGKLLIDIGASWGRWSIAACRLGYAVLALEPSLEAAIAGQRVARQLGYEVDFVVADARALPLPDESIDVAFSYSVLQHFTKPDAGAAVGEIARVLRPGGESLVQMPNRYGVRQVFNQIRKHDEDSVFRVRYWTQRELRRLFSVVIGPTSVEVDGFFSLNVQPTDADLLPPRARAVVASSEALRRLTILVPSLLNAADSLYVRSRRE